MWYVICGFVYSGCSQSLLVPRYALSSIDILGGEKW
jgi:hypothetical protein